MTIRKILAEASAELKSANIDTASLDASLLLAYILKVDRSKLLAMSEETLPEEILKAFRSLTERRKNGECAAYITEKKEFYGLEFYVNKSVLVPRPETEILVEKAIKILTANRTNKTNNVIDLCTGSGAIAIALKSKITEAEIFATDISVDALEVAKKNAERLLPNNNNITFLQGDLYNALLASACSLIVSNPPYIPTNEIQTLSSEAQMEPRIALDGGKTGLENIARIIKDAPNYLIKDGHILMEADPRQMERIKILLANSGFKDIIIYKDLAGLDRVIHGVYSC